MAPGTEIGKNWKEVNKARKEQRKKWQEEKLIKRLKKEELEQVSDEAKIVPETLKKLSTLSIAVPGSILENAQSVELRTYLAGQVARAASIFQVDEVIVFDDLNDVPGEKRSEIQDAHGLKVARQCCVQLARILQYLECPQYLRKYFFPIHKDLQFAGVLNPLDSPHHLRMSNDFAFREGVVTNKPVKKGRGSAINVGLLQDVIVDKSLTPGLRVTVKLEKQSTENKKKLKGEIVSPTMPRIETGVYWGYNVRLANSLSQVFTQSPYKKGYDLTIGTSDKGTKVDDIERMKYKHVLIVFGGIQGLEDAVENDSNLKVEDPSLLFDHYINTVPQQGSRTIRTEEAILVSLAMLRTKLIPKYECNSCS